ncbi:zinc ribbon domain-containing protein [Tepidiforma sp.]|uniref:FmdB family zinc ribbon protein n=1 Tax=Tepidiforma sp. TaxID=2682230 RepID=UPI002ADE1C21|nr:zinc ribbon domain-containing protein [Tepidiforma sp.]
MALYEYVCSSCGTRTEKRMPMSDVLQFIPCPACGKQAAKAFGRFAVTGNAQPGIEDGPAPWEREGGEDGGEGHTHEWGGGHSHSHGHGHSHGHSHGPGGHSHSHAWDDLEL